MHDLPINKKRLKVLIKKAKHYNIFPIFLPNYISGNDDHPISSPLSELVDEAYKYISLSSDSEIESLLKSLPSSITMMLDYKPELMNKEQGKRIALYYIISEVQRNYFSFKQVINYNLKNSEVLKVYPELSVKLDKDGLLCIDDNFTLHEGGIEYKSHMLHYHQLLRREYTSNPNFDFLGRFAGYYRQSKENNSFRIAIDHYRIMPKELYKHFYEFDTWYGPPFDFNKIDDPSAVGITLVKRNKDSLFELTNSLDRTEFYWSFRNGIKSLQIEEISSNGYKFENYVFNKYAHSERDTAGKIFRHLDGAVKVYLEDSYLVRNKTFLPDEAKCYKKIKLWRIDGHIDLENWINTISFFYKSNEMIIEYFNPKAFEEMFELRVRNFKEWKRQKSN